MRPLSMRVSWIPPRSTHVALALVVLALATSGGCGTKPPISSTAGAQESASAVKPASTTTDATASAAQTQLTAPETKAATPAATTNAQPKATDAGKPNSAAIPKPPVKPSPEQIAKWGLIDFEPLQLLACYDGFGDGFLQAMAVSPDGKQFVVGGAKLSLWKTSESQPSADLLADVKPEYLERPIRSVAISPDGGRLAAGDDKGWLHIWSLSNPNDVTVVRAHDSHLTEMAFSPDSQTLATTSYAGEVRLWNALDGKKLKSLKVSDQEVKGLAFLSNTRLATASKEVSVWSVESGTKETALTTGHVRGPALGISHDLRWLAFNNAESKTCLWDVENSAPTDIVFQDAAGLIDFSDDGKWIATYSGDSNIRIVDAKTGKTTQVIDADGGRTVAISWVPGTHALLIASELGRVRIWGTTETAKTIGIEPVELPSVGPLAADSHKSMTSAQFQKVIDLRSLPRLPGAVQQWCDFGMCAYNAPGTEQGAIQFYRYILAKAGWTEAAPPAQGGFVFRKEGCILNISFNAAPPVPGQAPGLQVSLHFAGNYNVGWLPKIEENNSKGNWSSFSSTSYRTKEDLTSIETAILKQFHEAGWTTYTRLNSSSNEEPNVRRISMLQGGSDLTISIGYPADSTDELVVQASISVSNKSLPIPTDAGWIEYDSSTNLLLVANTKLDLKQTAEFFDTEMAAAGWLSREVGRQFKDEKAWLPYIRGQQDVLIRLVALPEGKTRVLVGDVERSSWQLKKPDSPGKKKEKPGIEAADFTLPKGAAAIKYDVDQKQIEYELSGSTPAKLGDQFVEQMESLKWTREKSGVISDEYVFITFTKERSEVQLRARAEPKKATAVIRGDGLLWTKPLPTAPVRISYATWLRREHKDASLDHLNDFAEEMRKIPATGKSSK
jgi:WD40 repeat protein